jgi:hypothetical protein
LKELNANQVLIDSMLHMNYHEFLKIDKFLMSTSNCREKNKKFSL